MKSPPNHSATLTRTEVCELLNISERTFDNKRSTLERDFGFPPKLPGLKCWSRAAVTRWVTTNGETFMPDPNDPDGVADAQEHLEARYA